ncbi:MAG: AAA family ATPase [Candidatus Altiarchaeota archaeon]
MWFLSHQPLGLDGLIGKAAVEEARKWVGGPVIVYGGTGTGKSLFVRLLAAERGWDLVEVSGENIKEAERIANTGSLFGGRKAILIEDVDAIKDIKAVGELVEKTKSPVIMTTSDFDNKRLATLKKKSAKIQLRRPLPSSIAKHLKSICDAERVEVEKEVLELIAKNCSGDLRAAINDLETLCEGRSKVTLKDAEGFISERDRDSDIYKALSLIFGGRNFRDVVESTWDLDGRPENAMWWIEENTPRLYQDRESINGAYHNLARADVFLGRIMRRQYWGFQRYANVLMTAGVNSCRPEKIHFTQYMFPGYFAAMGRSKGARNSEKAIAEKMGPFLHASTRVVKRDYIPLYRLLLKKKKVTADELKDFYRLDDEDVEYLTS